MSTCVDMLNPIGIHAYASVSMAPKTPRNDITVHWMSLRAKRGNLNHSTCPMRYYFVAAFNLSANGSVSGMTRTSVLKRYGAAEPDSKSSSTKYAVQPFSGAFTPVS